jgi:hypothetical protein
MATLSPLNELLELWLAHLRDNDSIGECAVLQLADLDVDEKGGALRVRASKGNKHREVPMNGSARSALAPYLAPILESVDDSLRSVAQVWERRRRELGAAPLWQSQKGGQLSAVNSLRTPQNVTVDAVLRPGLSARLNEGLANMYSSTEGASRVLTGAHRYCILPYG